MNTDQWERAKQIFGDALLRPPADRPHYVQMSCGDDPELIAEVGSLLQAQTEAADFLDDPIFKIRDAFRDSPSKSRSPNLLNPGDLIADRFEIAHLLGAGGMGEVYKAIDLELGVTVALKTVRLGAVNDPIALSRFKKEVSLARTITHRNVCRIFDFGWHSNPEIVGVPDAQDLAFLTMEVLHGETLADLLRRGLRFSASEALHILRQIAAGLHEAHTLGIAHRDIKPSNIMLVTEAGGSRVVITDFGLARNCSSLSDPDAYNRGTLTDSAPAGTLPYMAPEQFAKGAVTPATDVYAFGQIAFEMLTGYCLMSLSRPSSQYGNSAADLGALDAPQIPPHWKPVILRCMEVNPERRFRTVPEIVDALEGNDGAVFFSAQFIQTRPAWKALATTIIATIAILVIAFVSVRPSSVVASSLAAGPSSTASSLQRILTTLFRHSPEMPVSQIRQLNLQSSSMTEGSARLYSEGLAKLHVYEAAESLRLLQQASIANPDDPLIHAGLAQAWQMTSEESLGAASRSAAKQAQAEIKTAYDRSPSLSSENQLWIKVLYDQIDGQDEIAERLAAGLFRSHPDNLEYGLTLASLEYDASVLKTTEMLRGLPAPLGTDPRIDLAQGRDVIVHPAQAEAALDRAIRKARSRHLNRILSRALLKIAQLYLFEGRMADCSRVATEEKLLLAESQTSSDLMKLNTLLAIAARKQGNEPEADQYISANASIRQETGAEFYDSSSSLNAEMRVAHELKRTGDYQAALMHYAAAFSEAKRNPAREDHPSPDMIDALQGMATMQVYMGHQAVGEGLEKHAVSMCHRDKYCSVPITSLTWAEVLFDSGNIRQAKSMAETALAGIPSGNKIMRASAMQLLASIETHTGRLDRASSYYQQALATLVEIGDSESTRDIRLELARLAVEEGSAPKAETLVRDILNSARENQSLNDQKNAESALAAICLSENRKFEAQTLIDDAKRISERQNPFVPDYDIVILRARVAAALGQVDAAKSELFTASAEAGKSGMTRFALQARLALGEVQINSGDERGWKTLAAVRNDANHMGFSLIARHASVAVRS